MAPEPTYTSISRPYDETLQRSDDLSYQLGDAAQPGSEGGSVEEVSVKSGGGIADLWIRNKIASENWKPKKTGFMLNGATGYAEFTDVYVSGAITALSGSIGGWTISTAELSSGSVKIQSTAERILMGAATAPLAGTGIFIGKDGADYELRAGNPSTSYMHWDGSALNIVGGVLTVATGTIGSITLDSTGHIKAGQTGYDNGTGFFLGYSATTPKFSLGNSAGNKMTWNGTALSITGNISGSAITGSTLSTATSGQRVELVSTAINFYNSSNQFTSEVYASGALLLISSQLISGGYVSISGHSTGGVILNVGGSTYFAADGSLGYNESSVSIIPATDNTVDLGSSTKRWQDLYLLQYFYYYSSGSAANIIQPTIHHGYVSGTTISKNNTSGFSATNPSTGNYTITHNFASANYTIQVTALRASGAGAYIAKVASLGTNSFDVVIFDDTGAAQNSDFMFEVLEN